LRHFLCWDKELGSLGGADGEYFSFAFALFKEFAYLARFSHIRILFISCHAVIDELFN